MSGGSWLTALPLGNLQNRQVQKVARSTNTARSSTYFDIDLQSARRIDVLALVVHNVSVTGSVRIRGSDNTQAFANLVSTTDLASASWNGYAALPTVTAATYPAPDGTNTAHKWSRTATTACYSANIVTKPASALVYGSSYEVKRDTARYFTIRISDVYPHRVDVVFDLQTLTVSFLATFGSYTGASASITPVGNGFYKCAVYATTQAWASVATLFAFNNDGGKVDSNDSSATASGYVTKPRMYAGYGELFDGGHNAVWPSGMIPLNLLEWEEDNYWLGTLSQTARAGYQSPYIYQLPQGQTLRYWRVEISDTGNSDGYLQLGRLFMAASWTPSVNYSYGAALGYEDPTPVDTSLSGAEFFDIRSKFRVFRFGLNYILESEAYSRVLELQRLAGTSGEVLLIPDPSDATNMPTRAYVGRLRQIGKITQPKPTAYNVDFELKELL